MTAIRFESLNSYSFSKWNIEANLLASEWEDSRFHVLIVWPLSSNEATSSTAQSLSLDDSGLLALWAARALIATHVPHPSRVLQQAQHSAQSWNGNSIASIPDRFNKTQKVVYIFKLDNQVFLLAAIAICVGLDAVALDSLVRKCSIARPFCFFSRTKNHPK